MIHQLVSFHKTIHNQTPQIHNTHMNKYNQKTAKPPSIQQASTQAISSHLISSIHSFIHSTLPPAGQSHSLHHTHISQHPLLSPQTTTLPPPPQHTPKIARSLDRSIDYGKHAPMNSPAPAQLYSCCNPCYPIPHTQKPRGRRSTLQFGKTPSQGQYSTIQYHISHRTFIFRIDSINP